jgi:hypothetical protein
MMRSFRKHPAYKTVLWALIVLSLVWLWHLNKSALNRPSLISSQDFSQFWAAGRLDLSGENPYDPDRIGDIKSRLSGLNETPKIVSIAYNPPWAVPIFMVLSLIDYPLSRLIWLLLSVLILMYCASRIWRLYGGAERLRLIPILAAFTFGPTFVMLRQGQVTPLVLLGVVGFMNQIEFKGNEWLAGVFAALVAIKPQILFLFWIALVSWGIDKRRWRAIVGLGLTLGVSTLMGMAFNMRLLSQYMTTAFKYPATVWFTPTIGSYLRLVFGQERAWLQFIPPLAGVLWFVVRWKNRHTHWRWSAELPSLIFVSLFTTPFGWTYDYAVLLVAIIPAAIVTFESQSRRNVAYAASAYLGINLVYLVLHISYTDQYFGWFLPAFWIVYLAVGRITGCSRRPFLRLTSS